MSLVPIPGAGSPTLQTPPTPNPTPFNFSAGQLVASAQNNTNNYALWNYLASLGAALNGATYCPAPAISSVAIGTGLSGGVGAATPGAGTQLTIGLAHGDYVDLASAQTLVGTKTIGGVTYGGPALTTGPVVATDTASGLTITVPSAATYGVRGLKWDGAVATTLWQHDLGGNFVTSGFVRAGNITPNIGGNSALASLQIGPNAPGTGSTAPNYITHGAGDTYPYVAGDYSGNEHIERYSGTVTSGTPVTVTYKVPFTAAPTVIVGYPALIYSQSLTSVTLIASGSVTNAPFGLIAIGY